MEMIVATFVFGGFGVVLLLFCCLQASSQADEYVERYINSIGFAEDDK